MNAPINLAVHSRNGIALNWLANYKLMPSFFRIEAVSEHPVPTHTHAGFGKTRDDEVHDLGESDYPGVR